MSILCRYVKLSFVWPRMLNSVRKFADTESSVSSKTALYDYHVSKNGKMVDFAGYLLPVNYSDSGIAASHIHTRKYASIFDVSHMLQTYLYGKDCVECFESICTADIKQLANNSGTLTVFTNEKGNILDDLIVSKLASDQLYVVSNAAMKVQDMEIMRNAISSFKNKGKDVSVEFLTPSDRSLIAVQGPEAVEALQNLTKSDLSKLYFMMTTETDVAGISKCRITRCGYTGEDGFEVSVPSKDSVQIVEALLAADGTNLKLAGLGARDSLRLEAGLCLYGTDIDAETSPIEAGLAWLVAKRRRNEGNFPGADIINQQLKNGVKRRRIGFRMMSGPPARHGIQIMLGDKEIGHVTSGCPSPSLDGNVGMGYVEEDFKKTGTEITLNVRNKLYTATIVKMPFIPSKYYMKPK